MHSRQMLFAFMNTVITSPLKTPKASIAAPTAIRTSAIRLRRNAPRKPSFRPSKAHHLKT